MLLDDSHYYSLKVHPLYRMLQGLLVLTGCKLLSIMCFMTYAMVTITYSRIALASL